MTNGNNSSACFDKIVKNMANAKKWFCLSAGIIFLITGSAKIWSSFGNAELLQRFDPILNINFRCLLLIVGILELILALFCLLNKSKTVAITMVAFLAGNLLAYRLGLWWIGWHRACACLGNLTDALHISPQTADTAMKMILAYLLIGSYAILFWLWRQKRKVSLAASLSGTATGSAS